MLERIGGLLAIATLCFLALMSVVDKGHGDTTKVTIAECSEGGLMPGWTIGDITPVPCKE